MTPDHQIDFRQLLNALPLRLRNRIAASAFVGFFLSSLANLFQPMIQSTFGRVLDVGHMTQENWLAIGAVIVFPAAFLYDTLFSRDIAKTPPSFGHLEEIIKRGRLGPVQSRQLWQALAWKIVAEFDLDAKSIEIDLKDTETKDSNTMASTSKSA